MEAYVAAVITGESKTKLRILDLTPNIKNNIVVCTEERFREILGSGIDVPGFSLCNNGKILYCGFDYKDCFPNVKSTEASNSKFSVIRFIPNEDGYDALILKPRGKVQRISAVDLLNIVDKATNISVERYRESANTLYHVINGGVKYLFKALDGSVFPTNGINRGNLYKLEIDQSNSGSEFYSEWIDIPKFIKIAEGNNIKYRLRGNTEFDGIEGNVKIINIPVGIESVYGLTIEESDLAKVEYVRIPNTVREISASLFKKAVNLKGIIFQSRDNSQYLSFSYTNFMSSKIDNWQDLVPMSLIKMDKLSPPWEINGDLSMFSNTREINASITGSKIRGGIILPDNTEEILWSITDINYLESGTLVIKIPSSVKSIKNSFKNINAEKVVIDFSEAVNLEVIQESFDSMNIETLDLSNCLKLKGISYQTFTNLPNLTEVKLPENLGYIGYAAFTKCPNLKDIVLPNTLTSVADVSFYETGIEKVSLPPSVDSWGTNAIVNIYVEPRKVFERTFSTQMRGAYIEIAEGLSKIGKRGFAELRCKELKLPNTIRIIQEEAFANSNIELDLSELDVDEIRDMTFVGFEGGYLILPKKTKRIGNKAFFNAKLLKKLYIPSTVESIGDNVFRGLGEKIATGTQLFLVKDSFIAKRLARGKYSIILCDTDDEAIAKLLGKDNLSSNSAIEKAKMMLNLQDENSVMYEFSDPKYIEHITVLNKLYTHTRSTVDVTRDTEVKLDFRPLKIWYRTADVRENVSRIISEHNENILDSLCISIEELDDLNTRELLESTLSNRFKVLCNFITSITTPALSLAKLDSLKSLYSNLMNLDWESNRKIIYEDKYSSIISLSIVIKTIRDGNIFSGNLIFISIGSNVVYVTARDWLDSGWHSGDAISDGLYPYLDRNEGLVYNVDDDITVGDTLVFRERISASTQAVISGVEIPKKLKELINKAILAQLVYICASDGNDKKMYMINTYTGWLYVGRGSLAYSGPVKSTKECDTLFIQGKYRIDSIPDKIKNELKNTLGNHLNISTRIDKYIDLASYLDNLKKSQFAYDSLESCYEFELAKALNKNNVKTIEDLNTKITELLFESMFFSKVKKGFKDLNRNYGRSLNLNLKDGSRLVTYSTYGKRASSKYMGFKVRYFSCIIKPGDDETTVTEVYASAFDMRSILSKVYNLYNEEGEEYGLINNTFSKLENFSLLIEITSTSNYVSAGIAVNNKDGVIYLIARRRTKVLPILRLKGTEEALKLGYMMFREEFMGDTSLDIKDKCSTIFCNMESYTEAPNNPISIARKAVLSGYPNGYKLENDPAQYYFDLAAKQL